MNIQGALNTISTLENVIPIWTVSGDFIDQYKDKQSCYYSIANATRRYKGKGKFKAHIGYLYGKKSKYKDVWIEYVKEDKNDETHYVQDL